jgi:hypothetical protein
VDVGTGTRSARSLLLDLDLEALDLDEQSSAETCDCPSCRRKRELQRTPTRSLAAAFAALEEIAKLKCEHMPDLGRRVPLPSTRALPLPSSPPTEEEIEYELIAAAYEEREPELAERIVRRYRSRTWGLLGRAYVARRLARPLLVICRPCPRPRARAFRVRPVRRRATRSPGRRSADEPSSPPDLALLAAGRRP